MRNVIIGLAAIMLLATSASAQRIFTGSEPTYTGTRTVGNLTVTVTLTTDGRPGALIADDILSFLVSFSDGSSFSGNSSNVFIQGDSLRSEFGVIGFNFAGDRGEAFSLLGSDLTRPGLNTFYCVTVVLGCGTFVTGEVANVGSLRSGIQTQPQTGFVPLFRLVPNVQSGVPEPATWAMMLIGFGGMGVALRRRRRMASTTQFA